MWKKRGKEKGESVSLVVVNHRFLRWYRFEEDQMNRVARKRVKRSGRGIGDSLDEVTDFSGLETLLDQNVCCYTIYNEKYFFRRSFFVVMS